MGLWPEMREPRRHSEPADDDDGDDAVGYATGDEDGPAMTGSRSNLCDRCEDEGPEAATGRIQSSTLQP